ncbi:unnamed protein product [Ceratitis capitata]|uniref:(Mediterranean fruit fly) hypothetical protein n=1 Tax=Ceratitis capitata TaxID=7213 RepID=A0A811UUT9_CERCA|nr:unnamed protein product [Ceratitis capitata]
MMKHDTGSTPIPIGEPNATASAAITAGSTSSLKRGLWRHRSVIETPVCARSPITKAFDFLPWGRNKKCVEKTQTLQEHQKQQQQQKQQQPQKFSSTSNTKSTNVAAGSCSNSNVNTNAPADKDVGIHYHRNIFRSGGGLIRDILGGDKLHKEKTSNSNQQELTLKKSSNQRTKPKQVVARNKSLDIHELINTVEHELKAEKSKNGRSQFMDDTFIENIMRAKEAYRREHNELPDQDPVDDDGNYRYVDETVDGECNAVRQTHEMQRASDEQLHCTPSGSAAANTPARHILFNDEDIVYLIKKELPVKREMSKTKRKVSANHGAMSEKERQQQHQQQQQREHERDRERARERSRDRHERSESVLRARLKFKKLTPDATPLPDRRSASAQMLNHNQYHNQSEYGISNEYGQPQGRNYQASRSVNDSYGDANNNSGSSKRSILQRQIPHPR